MELIKNNPYRVLGVLVGTGLKELTNKTSRLKMLLEADQNDISDYSFPVMGELIRTQESIEIAVSKLDLESDKINAAIFWFCNGSHTDEPAFDAIKDNKIHDSLIIWNKQTHSGNITKSNYSAYQNLSTFHLWNAINQQVINLDTLRLGIIFKIKFLESDFYRNFVKISTDDTFNITKSEIQKVFLEELHNELKQYDGYSETDLWNIVKEIDFSFRLDFLKLIIKEPSERIEKLITESKSEKKKDASLSINIGNNLIIKSNKDLKLIETIVGVEDLKYINLSDKLSNEIMQCAISYFNHLRETDIDPGPEAESLLLKASKIACGNITLERFQDNFDVIHEWNQNAGERLKYKRIKIPFEQIAASIEYYNNGEENIYNAQDLIIKCKPRLLDIGKELGFGSDIYINLCTNIVVTAQNFVINEINDLTKNKEKLFDFLETMSSKVKTLEEIQSVLERAWDTIMLAGSLDMDKEFEKNNYEANKRSLKNICRQFSVTCNENDPSFKKLSKKSVVASKIKPVITKISPKKVVDNPNYDQNPLVNGADESHESSHSTFISLGLVFWLIVVAIILYFAFKMS